MSASTEHRSGAGNTIAAPQNPVATGRYRNFAFTAYNGLDVAWEPKTMQYLIKGNEICPTSGRPHIQGLLIYKNPRTLFTDENGEGVIKDYPGIHFEVCYKSAAINEAYCMKDGKYVAFGEAPKGQGARTDIRQITDAVKEGKSDREIIDEFKDKALRVYKGIEWVRNAYNDEKRNWKMDVRIYWGNSESGKTRAVYDEFGIENVYEKPIGKWWDNYRNQKVVIIDDFDPENCFDIVYDFYLKLLDRYPMQVEIKGGYRNFNSRVIIFTSNHDPKSWFSGKSNRKAWERRITEIRYFEGGIEEEEKQKDIFEGMDARTLTALAGTIQNNL